MAVADDRSPLARLPAGGARGGPWRGSWLGALALLLTLGLLVAAAVQIRQFALLTQAVRGGNDYVVLTIYQVEAEHLRLSEQWTRALSTGEPIDRATLQLRYDVWVSRVGLLTEGGTRRLIESRPGWIQTVQQMEAFVARADRWLGEPAGARLDLAALRDLQPGLLALGPPIHGLSLAAAHDVSDQFAERNRVVRRHNQIGIALTILLAGMTLAFAAIVFGQMRQLQARRQTLEDLAASLHDARREAEIASQAKSAFLANMSHEIRTPFHGLLGMLSLLRETSLAPRQLDYLRTATESADHLLAILNDILDISQLESGRMVLAPVPIDLREMLRTVDALMRPQATAKSLALHVDAEPQVPEWLVADPTRVKQVLFNLLSNAIKFSDRGAVVLDVRVREHGEGRRALGFIVTDTGIGMDEATLARLFRRFSQGDETRSRRFGGAGLGLEISRNLARLMGGDISVRSEPGHGSSFSFQMPIHELPVPPVPAGGAAPTAGPLPTRLRVLAAEDHPVNRQYMAALLGTLAHDAWFASDGHEAVQAVRDRRFDVVLMDMHMPQLDGLGATRAIRALADPAAATVPIVALTADAFPETRERCLLTGMNDFLTKPVSPEQLATALRRLFGPPGSAAAAAPQSAAAPPLHDGLIDPVALQRTLTAVPRAQLAAMVHSYLQQGVETVQHLRAAVRDGRPLDLRVHAHATRGAALNLGLPALAATAEALHEGAAHLPAHEIARLVQRFEQQLGATGVAAHEHGLSIDVEAAATSEGR